MTGIPDRLTTALSDRYRIERELGAGGMATVYLADDLKHNRKVALKVLKPELAAVVGAERFLAEIETTAQLQHPHILPLFDSGEADTFLYYVMPYVEGETLRERLDRERQLPVQEAVTVAGKVASALGYAHERGVVHRDIKPANILVSRGEPLVADFGIALALGAAGGGRLTETGLSVGTPYYMSPEQATGDQNVGPASDVYALGCVLYELLVGDPPYSGSTAQAVLGKIIAGDTVSPTKERPSIPGNVDAAIRRALEKLPADRFASADDFGRALQDPSFRHGEAITAAGSDPGPWKLATGVTSVIALGALVLAALGTGQDGVGTRDVGLPWQAPMLVGRVTTSFDVAPDASFMVYEAQRDQGAELWYRSLTDDESRPLPGTEGTFGKPVISPDGSRVAFAARGELKAVDLTTGRVTVIGGADLPTGAEWRGDGLIVFSEDDGRTLQWVDPEAGPVREEAVRYCLNAIPMADDTEVLCGGGSWKFAFSRRLDDVLAIEPWRRGDGTGLAGTAVRGSHFTVVEDAYLVYVSMDGSLMAAPILDVREHTVGRSTELIPNIRREPYTGYGQFTIARDGTLVYASGLNAEVGRLVHWTADGGLRELNVDEAIHLRYRESPDGLRLATVVETVQEQELRVYSLRTGAYEVVEQAFWISAPLWSPDGQSLVYDANDETLSSPRLIQRRLNSPELPRVLLSSNGDLPTVSQPGSFVAPERLLLGASTSGIPARVLDVTADPAAVDSLPFDSYFLSMSPDGRWIVLQEDGRLGVYLYPYPELDRQYAVSLTGSEAQWLSSGDLVYYDAFDGEDGVGVFAFYRVSVDPDSDSPVGEPQLMFDDPRFADTPGWSHSPARDGGVIYLQSPVQNTVHYVRVIPDWVDQMKAAVQEANR